jgi:hypothetical protein
MSVNGEALIKNTVFQSLPLHLLPSVHKISLLWIAVEVRCRVRVRYDDPVLILTLTFSIRSLQNLFHLCILLLALIAEIIDTTTAWTFQGLISWQGPDIEDESDDEIP